MFSKSINTRKVSLSCREVKMEKLILGDGYRNGGENKTKRRRLVVEDRRTDSLCSSSLTVGKVIPI